jgi:hypothetical protein
MTEIMLEINYYTFVKLPKSISAESILELMASSEIYRKSYGDTHYSKTDQKVSIQFANSGEFQTPETETIIEMSALIEDNNRLKRMLDIAEEKLLNKSESKELGLI